MYLSLSEAVGVSGRHLEFRLRAVWDLHPIAPYVTDGTSGFGV
jgi:hypothetical protein